MFHGIPERWCHSVLLTPWHLFEVDVPIQSVGGPMPCIIVRTIQPDAVWVADDRLWLDSVLERCATQHAKSHLRHPWPEYLNPPHKGAVVLVAQTLADAPGVLAGAGLWPEEVPDISPFQMAMLAVRCCHDWKRPKGAKYRPLRWWVDAFGVTYANRTLERIGRILKQGHQRLVDLVWRGEIGVRPAIEFIRTVPDLHHQEQTLICGLNSVHTAIEDSRFVKDILRAVELTKRKGDSDVQDAVLDVIRRHGLVENFDGAKPHGH